MSSCLEDQANEMEALASIYAAEFTQLSASQLRLQLEPSLGSAADAPVFVGATLSVSFPALYPEAEAPLLQLSELRGLSSGQAEELRSVAAAAAAEQAGSCCVYSVAEAVREWLGRHNSKQSDGSAFDEMMARRREAEGGGSSGSSSGSSSSSSSGAAYARENDPSIAKKNISHDEADEATRRKRDGTPVTVESFAAWRAAFEADMEAKEKAEAEMCVGGASSGAQRLSFSLARAQASLLPPLLLPSLFPLSLPWPAPLSALPCSTAASGAFVLRKAEKGRATGRQLFETGDAATADGPGAAEEGVEDVDYSSARKRAAKSSAAAAAAAAGGSSAAGAEGEEEEEADEDYEPSEGDDDEEDDEEEEEE